jgi:hypothetical protein
MNPMKPTRKSIAAVVAVLLRDRDRGVRRFVDRGLRRGAGRGLSVAAFGDQRCDGCECRQSGDTTESALARIDDVVTTHPRIVIVGLGGNDFLNGIAL